MDEASPTEDEGDELDEQDNQSSAQPQEAGDVTENEDDREPCEVNTVTSKKLKGATIGRGFTAKKGGATRVAEKPRRRTDEEINKMKKDHPCAACGQTGHLADDRDADGKPVCPKYDPSFPRKVKAAHFTEQTPE